MPEENNHNIILVTDDQIFVRNKKLTVNNTNSNINISLYLVILAFFILLCSSSSFDNEKAKIVRKSVNSQFFKYDKQGNQLSYSSLNSLSPDFKKVYDIFLSMSDNISLIEDMLTVTLPMADIYKKKSVYTDPYYDQYFVQIADIVKNNRFEGYLYRIICYIHTKESQEKINIQRIENFAKHMLDLGVMPASITLGLLPDREAAKVQFSFMIKETSLVFNNQQQNNTN